MHVIVVTPPEPIVSLVEAKQQLKVDTSAEDAQIEALVAVATQSIDGPDGWLGRALGEQMLELRLAGFYCDGRAEIDLPFRPLIAIDSIKYDAADGTEGTVDPSSYNLFGSHGVYPKPGSPWPQVRSGGEARIRYRAGWPMSEPEGDIPAAWTGPAPIKHAVLMMVTRLYHHRGEDIAGTLVEDRAISALLSPYRVWSL